MQSKQFLIFTLGLLGAFILAYTPSLYKDLHVYFSYKQTACTILNKQVGTTSYGKRKPITQVAYTANNMQYQRWIYASRIYPLTNTNFYADYILKPYSINSNIACWYDPYDPQQVVLNRAFSLNWILFIFFAAFLSILSAIAYRSSIRVDITKYKNNGELFAVQQHVFTEELIYLGTAPMTEAMLPPKFSKRDPRAKAVYVKMLNEKKKIVYLRKFYSKLFFYWMLIGLPLCGLVFIIQHL